MYFTDQNLLESGYLTEIQNWSKLKDRTQRVEKNEVIRLFMFIPIVIVIEMSNMSDFMYYLLDTAKYPFQFGQDIQEQL